MESNEQNKLMNKIETEAWMHGTDGQLSEERAVGAGDSMKEGEGIN